MRQLRIPAQAARPHLIAQMEAKGLLRRLKPSAAALAVKEGDQLVEVVELARDGFGPWQMLAVACNRTKLDHLAAHSDIESWLYFSADPASKPLLYVVATCPADEFRAKAAAGTLAADDFIALEIQPNDPEAGFFTVPGGVLHDELTYPGPGVGPVFFVPESSRMTHLSVPLDRYAIQIVRC
jgi:hypothetical protein